MLFFLRQLRRIELRKRSGQYFIYAFGEILLIVVGILIAMQIQNWNEGRKDRERVRGHLEEIKSGLVFDLERREEMMKSLNLHDEAGVYLMDYLSDKSKHSF
jgi:hypothetical protein